MKPYACGMPYWVCTLQLFKAILIGFPWWHFLLMVYGLHQAHMITPYACGMPCQVHRLQLFRVTLVAFPYLHFHAMGCSLYQAQIVCTLCLWDATSGAYIATLQGHSNLVTSVAFSPDSLWLVSGSWDNTLCLWDTVLGVHIATLQGHSNWIFSVSFSSDGHTLISQSHSETFAWDLRSQPLQLVPTSIPRAPPSTISHSSLINSEVGGWIQAMDSEDNVAHICYIPPHYHSSTTVQASSLATQPRIAIGCADGHVIIVDPQDHPFVHGHEGVVTFS